MEATVERRTRGRTKTTDGPGTRVAIYVRVSTEEQTEGYSLAAQERAAETFCQQKAGRSSPATATRERVLGPMS